MKVLILSPLYDLASAVGTRSALKLQNYCIRNNIDHDFKFMGECLRWPFEMNASWNKYDLVAYFGHGEKDYWYGQEVIGKMFDRINSHLLKDSIIYALSCHTACLIGPDAVQKGAKAYFGDNTYYYGALPNWEYAYLKDWLDYVTIIPKSLMMGKTTLESLNLYREKINNYIEKYKELKPLDWDWYIKSSLSNMNNFELIGNKFTKLRL